MVRAPRLHPLNRMKVAPVRVYGEGRQSYIDTYAVLDTAAGDCLCSKELLDLLNLKGEARRTAVMAATGTTHVSTAHYLTLEIRGYRTSEIFPIDVIALENLTDLSEHIPSQVDIDRHPHMRGLQIPNHERKRVDILICIGESRLQHTYDTRIAEGGQLWASCTGLGWVVHGRDSGINCRNVPSRTVQVNAAHIASVECAVPPQPPEGECEILQKVRQTFAIDFSEPQHSKDKIMSRTGLEMLRRQHETFQIVNGRCEVGKLWRKSPHSLPNNRWLADQSLRRLGRRLLANPKLLNQYKAFFDNMVEKKQAEIAQQPLGQKPGYFLPHHPVLEKFRVVFNGAARYQGHCLNDFLDKGPEHTSSLIGALLRFSLDRYAVSADIKGMFYNVGIPEADRDFMRFLWFQDGDPTKPIIEYRLTHQVPGLTDSPSNACFSLRQLIEESPAGVSDAVAKAIRDNFYVDDGCLSGSDFNELRSIVEGLSLALSSGGFHLTKWLANHPALLQGIPKEDHKPRDKPIAVGDPARDKILGIWWDTATDEFRVRFKPPTRPPTLRGILSYVMSPFDPRGMTLPYLLDMKLLVQRLFSGKWGWDTLLTGADLAEWTRWVAELPDMEQVSCKRVLRPRPGYKAMYLCVFTDASERGYSAVCYIVCEYDNESTSSFALGKVRVAPKKKLVTIPRLELLGAVIGVEAAATIQAELRVEFTGVYFWTDSTTVLHWVSNPDLQLKAFVANRVAKVIEGSEGATWSYVSTKENPADIGSRGLRPADGEGIRPWLEGPPWLRTGKDTWPLTKGNLQAQPAEKDLEIKKINALKVKTTDPNQEPYRPPLDNLFKRYSSLQQLTTTAAWLLRLRRILHSRSNQKLDTKHPLTASEADQALIELVRAAQWTAFPMLMQALAPQPPVKGKELDSVIKHQQKNLQKLAPFLDEYGLLRVGGRLQRGGFSYEKTHPLILPRRHELTGLLVLQHHQDGMHRGYNYVLARLRERFWIIGGTGTVRHYLAACIKCRHVKAPMGTQQMAPLPPSHFRTGYPAFTYAAVDYFGPLQVRVRRATVKRWGCLMTCLTTRAVHIEVAHSLTTDSFLMAFRRFTSTYPSVREMLSDNGTNFVGADRKLKEEFLQEVDFNKLAHGLRKDAVDFRWKFNPPAASHQGGIFERMIGLVRSCLRRTMQDVSYRTPSDEGLLTTMKGIEGVLNNRPLLPAGLDPESYDVITPAQIIRPGTPAIPQLTREFTNADSLRQGYRSSQWHVDEFWRRFSSGYVPMLQKRAKWLHPQRNFRVGDLVLIQDKDAPRHQWRMAMVTKVHPNPTDGLVRRVTLQPGTKVASLKPAKKDRPLERDVRYICLLEASPELDIPSLD